MMTRRVPLALTVCAVAVAVTACNSAPRTSSNAAATRPEGTSARVVLGTLPVKRGWIAEGVGYPRFAPDGRGIYYLVHWLETDTEEVDSRASGAAYVASIAASPTILNSGASGVPIEIREWAWHEDYEYIDIGVSPDGRLKASMAFAPSDDADYAVLTVQDKDSASRRTIEVPAFGGGPAAWVDSRTLIMQFARPDFSPGCIQMLLVDAGSGRIRKLPLVTLRPGELNVIERIVSFDSRSVLFSVSRDDVSSSDSSLYRYFPWSDRVESLGKVPMGGDWDYSRTRHRIVSQESENGPLMERSLTGQ